LVLLAKAHATRFTALAIAATLLGGLAACGRPMYRGDDAGTLQIRTEQSGCCYIEGSLHFARLEGPTRGEFSLEDSKDRDFDPRGPNVVGVLSFGLKPGHYRLSVWERVCDGNCQPENLDEPGSAAEAEFDIVQGEELSVLVRFPLLKQTTIEVGA
jgi:hypothetical protein